MNCGFFGGGCAVVTKPEMPRGDPIFQRTNNEVNQGSLVQKTNANKQTRESS